MSYLDFDKYVDAILDFEGELSDHPKDTGGLTKFGISQKAFPNLDIAKLTVKDAKLIYYKYYWIAARCHDLPVYLRLIHFDTAVNFGVKKSIKILQTAITGIQVDGVFGQQTFQNAHRCTLAQYTAQRCLEYGKIVAKNPSQRVFLVGWMNRVVKVVHL